MSFFTDLLEKPPNLSAASKYTVANGVLYMGAGALLVVWPAAVQVLLMDPVFVGHEGALIRAMGLTVVVIGWLYLWGGRTGARQFVVSTVIDRIVFVPAVLLPLALAGVFPHLFVTFAILDVVLAIGALVLRSRET
jgi:hypothetical protein